MAPSADPARVLEALADPVLAIDAGGQVIYANGAAEAFFRTSAAALRARCFADLVPGDSPLHGLLDQARRQEGPVSAYALTIEAPRIGRTEINARATPLPEGAAGDIVLRLGSVATARRIDRQLDHRAAARSVKGLASVLAHEVKNPLSGVRGAAQLLERHVAANQRGLTQLIRDEADRIVTLLERMDSFADPRPAERGPVNIHAVVDHARQVAEAGFAAHATIRPFFDPSLPPVLGNRDQLVQVVLNLLKNAAEVLPAPGGEITIRTAYQHGLRLSQTTASGARHLPVLVTVADNGPGIPADVQPHLFEAFVSHKPEGTGLGLALVAKIVAEHDGLVDYDTGPNGTAFRISLPLAADDDGQAATSQQSQESGRQA